MKIKILCDSSCDMISDKSKDFGVVPLTVNTSEKSYIDNENLDVCAMLEDFARYKGKSGSACPSIGDWLSAFEEADIIYVITMTSAISGTYNSAVNAKEIYLESHPESKIEVFDTLTTASELRLIAEKAIDLAHSGKEFEQVCTGIRDYIAHTRLFFSLESLRNLAQNGRVNKLVASVAGILGIKIFGTASTEGTLESISKCRSYLQIIKALFEQLESAGYEGGKIRIAHVENEVRGELLRQELQNRYPDADILMYPAKGLCSFYAEKGGLLLGFECTKKYEKAAL